ncbi:MAG: aminomethyl transferase family protein [Firmicutes bacterium]|nr:aminomethyl transferase family protein [Bacillota bacterium]
MYYKNVYKYDDMKRSEHMAVRTTVGWYLWTHHLVEVTGEDAADFLDTIFLNNISNLKNGRERYTCMLDENAEIIDDVVIFRFEEQKFWISTLFAHYLIPWLDAHKGDAKVKYTDITKKWDMYAVQGPKSLNVINSLTANSVDEMKFFSIADNEIDGIPVKINRAGFTGEKLGYEIYVPSEKGDKIEEKIRVAADKLGGKEVTEFQVMAWTLPTEAGFYYMRDLRHVNPLEVGLDKGINWDKEFIGKDALKKIYEEGPKREMVGFTVEDVDIHIKGRHMGSEGELVMKDEECVGRCAKIVYSYLKEINNGIIIAKKGALKNGDKVTMHGHEAIICDKRLL